MTELLKQLSSIQKELNAPKSQWNKFGKYNYRNCEDILQAVKSLLGDSVILLNDEIEQIGDRVYVKATATFHCGEKSISTTAYAREALDKKGMDSAQVTGATSSYARKYALNGLLLIDDNKDADSHDNSKQETTYKLTDTDRGWITAVKENNSVLEQITDPQYKELIKRESGL